MGLLWVPELARWYTTSELLSAMGFPISLSAQQATGVACQFSVGQCGTYPGRSRHSVKAACGNAMHVNAVGS
eukprot:12974309-Alexandrium_andersonii.AAC.1